MRALVLNCTLKASPEPSNTERPAQVVIDALGVQVMALRPADLDIPPGVVTDLGDGVDQWPVVHARLLESQILVVVTPTWVGRPSSLAQRMLERMDAMISETDEAGRPVAYNRVAGVLVTGNEDGAPTSSPRSPTGSATSATPSQARSGRGVAGSRRPPR